MRPLCPTLLAEASTDAGLVPCTGHHRFPTSNTQDKLWLGDVFNHPTDGKLSSFEATNTAWKVDGLRPVSYNWSCMHLGQMHW